MGPVAQIQKMFAKTRVIATVVMILSLVLTLCSVFWWDKKILALFFVVLQVRFDLVWANILFLFDVIKFEFY